MEALRGRFVPLWDYSVQEQNYMEVRIKLVVEDYENGSTSDYQRRIARNWNISISKLIELFYENCVLHIALISIFN